MVVCGNTFFTATEFNNHCKQVHGVVTTATFREVPAAPSAPLLDGSEGLNPDEHGAGMLGMVEGLTHVMKNMSSKNDQHIPRPLLHPWMTTFPS